MLNCVCEGSWDPQTGPLLTDAFTPVVGRYMTIRKNKGYNWTRTHMHTVFIHNDIIQKVISYATFPIRYILSCWFCSRRMRLKTRIYLRYMKNVVISLNMYLTHIYNKCDRIWENPACCENAQVTQCAFLVTQVKNCQSPVFVIFMSKNLSTNPCRHLWKVKVSYQGKISLHFAVYGTCC